MPYTHTYTEIFSKTAAHLSVGNLDLCMEIGCFEGCTSNFIAEHLLNETGKLICVDPLGDEYILGEVSDNYKRSNTGEWSFFAGQYDRFVENTSVNSAKIELYRQKSEDAFVDLIEKYKNSVDLIYIDGDHRADPVYNDAINSFELLKQGGIIVFDDYNWGANFGPEAPKIGIDRFLSEYNDRISILINANHTNLQMTISKK